MSQQLFSTIAKIGEEPSYEMTDDGIVGHGNLGLGLTKDQVTSMSFRKLDSIYFLI